MEEYKDIEVKEDEKDKIIEHHEFDGIRELDNPPPPWLVYLFFASIIFAAFYLLVFHVIKTGDNQVEKYEAAMAKAEANKPKEDVEIVFLTDAESLKAGEEIYKAKTCNTCHFENLEGSPIAPNLTDEYWIHGNTAQDLYKVLINGIPNTAMTTFQDKLTKKQMVDVISFIHSKQGSNPPNAWQPQGEKY